MTLRLRYMNLSDIPTVLAIDRLSFEPAWSARSYAYEISESTYSHMVVLEHDSTEQPVRGWRKLVRGLSGTSEQAQTILGYGGLWHIVDEAHISTIATHPTVRGRGWGELLLVAMIQRAITLKAGYIVLEVRVSNTIAQRLYRKYDFETTAVKPRYYHNNGEDAYNMRLQLEGNHAFLERFAARYAELMAQHAVENTFSTGPSPRR